MYILVQTNSLENCENTIYIVHAPELEKKYQNAGYQRYERIYKLKYQHKEYIVVCPEYRNDDIGTMSIVVVPMFLIPRRPYPVQVYLRAIDLYSNNPGMGQRKAAEMTRKLFGLSHFAHTTLGRALKVFVRQIEETTSASDECDAPEIGKCRENGQSEAVKEDVIQQANNEKQEGEKTDEREQIHFPTTQATADWRKRAASFLEGNIRFTTLRQFVEDCFKLAKKWFKKYCRFLL
jgi:hypothetical protein